MSTSYTFRNHPKCEKLGITNLCFTDDLLLFSYGNLNSVSVLMQALDEFKEVSGLKPSMPKSTAFCSYIKDDVKNMILQIMPFEVGKFPVRYLCVPLISTRLVYKDCEVLVERVRNRISDWKNKSLSFAGRLQLIISVLSSMHVYWSAVFIIFMSILLEIEKILRRSRRFEKR